MLNLLTAFVLFQFNAHWLWWVAFSAFLAIELLIGILEAMGNG
jgi:hypothetical protein